MVDNNLSSMNTNQTPASRAPFPNTSSDTSSNKMIRWLVMGLLAIALITGGIYLFSGRQNKVTQKRTDTIQTPGPSTQENIENELNSINVEAPVDSDFSSVDQDLQQL